jgi:hypothetical protein
MVGTLPSTLFELRQTSRFAHPTLLHIAPGMTEERDRHCSMLAHRPE